MQASSPDGTGRPNTVVDIRQNSRQRPQFLQRFLWCRIDGLSKAMGSGVFCLEPPWPTAIRSPPTSNVVLNAAVRSISRRVVSFLFRFFCIVLPPIEDDEPENLRFHSIENRGGVKIGNSEASGDCAEYRSVPGSFSLLTRRALFSTFRRGAWRDRLFPPSECRRPKRHWSASTTQRWRRSARQSALPSSDQ